MLLLPLPTQAEVVYHGRPMNNQAPLHTEVKRDGNDTWDQDPAKQIFSFMRGPASAVHALADYSVTPAIWAIQPPAGETYYLNRMIINVEDTVSPRTDRYGGTVVLTNGLQLRVENDSGTLLDLFDGEPLFANKDWGRYAYDVRRTDFQGGGVEPFASRWSFFKGRYPVRLIGDNNERLEIVFNDDFTGLLANSFFIHGFKT